MSVLSSAPSVLLILLVAGCTSLRQSLVRLLLVALLLLLTHGFCSTLRRFSLPAHTELAVVFAFNVGTALCLVLRVLFPNVPCEPDTPLTALLLTACGLSALRPQPADWRLIPAVLLIGGLRELLSAGALWSIPLCSPPVSAAFREAVGGLPIAAAVLCCFRLTLPLRHEELSKTALPLIGGVSAVAVLLGIVTADLPLRYCLGGITAVCALLTGLLSSKYSLGGWLFLCPALVLLTRSTALWWPVILVGIAVPLCIAWLNLLYRRMCFSLPLGRRPDVPLVLMTASVVCGIGTAFPPFT